MSASTTLRVTPEIRQRLARLAARRGISTAELIGQLAVGAETEWLFEQTDSHYAELRADASAWAALRSEREAWEATLLDGLSVRCGEDG